MALSTMLGFLAFLLLCLWVLGLLTSFPGGAAVHLFLAAALIVLVIRSQLKSRSRGLSEVSPAGILAIVTRQSRDKQ